MRKAASNITLQVRFVIRQGREELEPANDGRFVNHSCQPNCQLEIWKVDGKSCPALFAGARGVGAGEEVTFDYSDGQAQNVMRCLCGAANCRGSI